MTVRTGLLTGDVVGIAILDQRLQANNADHRNTVNIYRQPLLLLPSFLSLLLRTHKLPTLNMTITEIFLRNDSDSLLSSYRGRHIVTRSRNMLTAAPAHACALMLLHLYGPGYSPSQCRQAALIGRHWKTEMSTQTMR